MKGKRFLLLWLYFVLGFLNEFIDFTIRKDLKRFNVGIAQMDILIRIPVIPWMIKVFFGILIDRVKIFGSRRKSYIILSNVVASILTLILMEETISLGVYITMLFFVQVFACIADVVYDCMMIEITRNEENSKKGNYQVNTWLIRSLGLGLAALLGPVIWNQFGERVVYLIQALMFSTQAMVGTLVSDQEVEYKVAEAPPVTDEIDEQSTDEESSYIKAVRKTFSNSVFYKLTIFNVLTGLTPSAGLAMFFFLTDELKYPPELMGLLDAVGVLSKIIGILLFKYYFHTVRIRKLYAYSIFFGAFVAILPLSITLRHWDQNACDAPSNQTMHGGYEYEYIEFEGIWHGMDNNRSLVNINDTNDTSTYDTDVCYLFEAYGIPSVPFAFSDDVFEEILDQLRHMPFLSLTGMFCMRFVEGLAYSLSLGIINTVYVLKGPINREFMKALDIDHNRFGNLPWFLGICTSINIATLLLIRLIPNKTIRELFNEDIAKKAPIEMQNIAPNKTKTEEEKEALRYKVVSLTEGLELESI